MIQSKHAQGSPFKKLPEQVVIAAVAEADGQYSVYVKTNCCGEYARLGRRLSASKALAFVDHLRVELELPEEAAYMEDRDAIRFSTYAAAVRLYGALEKGGVSV